MTCWFGVPKAREIQLNFSLVFGLANTGVVYFRVVESPKGYTITPCVGYFTSPGI